MKVLKHFLTIAFALFLVACGSGNSNEVNLKVEADLQNLGEYLTIEDEQVIVKLVENDDKHFTILSSLGINVKKSVASDYSFTFEVEVLDKNHIKITDLPDYTIESKDDYSNDYHSILLMGSKRANMEESISTEGLEEEEWAKAQEMWDKIKKEGVYISIKPEWSSAKYIEYKGSMSEKEDESIESDIAEDIEEIDEEAVVLDDDTDDTSSSGNGNSIDKLLSEYETFADEYIAFLKKIDTNDPTALVKIAEWTNKQTSIISKLQDMHEDMDIKHLNRMNKINIKIANAASKLKR